MKILVCLPPMAGHIQALLPIIVELIKKGCVVDVIIDEVGQVFLQNCAGINHIYVHPTFMTEEVQQILKIQFSQRNADGIVHESTLANLHKLLMSLCEKALPIISNINPKEYELLIMDDFAIYAIPFVKKYNLKFIVSQSAFISQDMVVDLKKLSNSKDISNLEQLLGVDFQKQEFIFNLDYAEKVIIYSSELLYTTPLKEKYVFVMNNQIVEFDQNKSLNNDNSIILISLGTIFNNNVELFNLLINYFANTNHQVIVTFGNNKILYEQFQSQQKYKNIQIELWIDQKETLKKTSLFITHSGFNGIKESIQSNTPMITLPQNADQPFISKILEQLGVSLELKEYSMQQLNLIYNQIKDNYQQFQNKLKIVQESFKNTMNTEQFVDSYVLNQNKN